MSVFLDTNMIVRYLTGVPIEQFAQASRIINETENLLIPDIALTEVAYILRDRYQVSRESIVDRLIALIQKDNVSVYAINDDLALQGLRMCRPSGRLSIADAMIWAAARTDGASAIYTFDRRFPGQGIEIRQTL